MEGFRQLVK